MDSIERRESTFHSSKGTTERTPYRATGGAPIGGQRLLASHSLLAAGKGQQQHHGLTSSPAHLPPIRSNNTNTSKLTNNDLGGFGTLDPSSQQVKTVAGIRGGGFYPAYSLSGSDGEGGDLGSGSPVHVAHTRSLRRTPHHHHPAQHHQYQTPSYAAQHLSSAAGLSDTPTSENASDATLTDSELALARDSTLLVQNGGFLEGGPPDVPPRNPSMSRLNGRSTTGLMGNPADRDGDFEPSCLVRTPSGNVYIPTDIPKTSPMDYKSNSSCSSPSKGDNQKMNSDRCSLPFGPGGTVPGLPVRNNLRRPNSTHFPQSSRSFQFRKGLASKCSWKCTAIVFIILSVVLTAALTYMSATNLLNWSYQSAKACTVLVGENSDLYPLKGSDLNRTSSRGTRPSAGGKYLSQKFAATDDDAMSTSIKSYNLMSTSKLASFYLPPSQANRIRRSVVHNNNQHGNADAPPSTVVDVVSHASLTTLHGQLVRDDDQFEAIEEGSGSEASRNDPHGEHASTAESHASVHAPSSEHDSNATDTITDEELAEELGSGFILASAESVQHDSPVYAYGVDEVEIVHLDRNIPSPDANKLNNEVKEVLSLTRNKPTVSSKNETIVSGVMKLTKNDTLRNITELIGLGSEHDNKTVHFKLNDAPETSEELQSGKPHDLLTASRHTSGDIRRSTTDEEVLHVSEDFADQHGLSVLTSSDTTEQHRHVEHSAIELHNHNNSSRHMKRVLVNVTIATEDDDESSSHSEHSPSHPMYVLSVSVPTDAESKTSPNLSHNASIVLGLSDVNSSLLVNLAQPQPSPIQETIKPTTTTTTTLVPGIQFWGGECQCSCPCLDDTDSNEEQETTSTQLPMSAKDNVEENGNQTTPERLILEVVREEMNETMLDLSLESINDSSIENSTIDETNTTVELPSEETTVEYSSSSSTTEEAFSAVSTSTMSEVQCPTPTPPPPMVLILEGAKTFPARTFPPDGTTFSQVSLGQRLSRDIPQYGYWNMQFYQSEAAYIKFDYSIPRGASIGVYARRNALPTHTQYDFIEVLSGFKARTTRGSTTSVKKEVTHYMEQGHWFVSLYNDDGDPQEVSFIAVVAEDMTENCPNGCSGKGECLLGHCHCNPGFGGDDCSESVCPVLCSQRGEYINGECQCNPGWKGKECSLRHDECEVPDCNGHGHCANGKCACVRGYKGKFCEEVDCPHPTCSGHGFCVEGGCICKKGWKGPDCSQTDDDALMCLPSCSSHGTFNLETQTCTCEAPWTGDDCSRELCDLDCGPNGHCEGDACACDSGWAGDYCNLKQCDARCSEHGQCKNGTCLCVTGWNGRHCTLEGCPNSCSAHGQCKVNTDGAWECRCYDGWDGIDCSVALEQSCSDSRDNDKDGLVDCEDPECCSNHLCRSSQLCVSAPKPIDILLRKQPPAITASFFERMKFLIEEGSLQNYARQESFNESRTAVVRGRVVTASGMGLMGVRVSTSQHLEGFTLTREDGWFDLLVNGGGAVTLQFGRSPFRPQTQIVNVPWNEVVIINTVVMGMGDDKGPSPIPHSCEAHDYDLMKPVVLATWKHGFQGACPDKSAILAESQVVQDSLQIPGTGLNLVYHSSRAAGYLSTIQLQLTPHTIPPLLKLVHLRITIEGILFEKTFEADPDIKFTYAWNRLNVYRQRVYGVTTAMVKVGYEYAECKDIIWDVQTTKLSGHDMSISEVGGWNLDIHHRYNFHEGILQKGDGSNIYLKHKPRVILTTMGNGHQRALDCTDCEGQASKQRLLAPVALTYAPDGSIFVGDFNLIRRLMVDGTVRTVVRLNATRVSYRYHLALSPLDNVLYISDPESHQIIRVRNIDDFSDPDHNWEPAVGSGERCLPGDEAHCGDGALARDAKLAYPKGVAVSAENVIYFADGTNIRMIDRDGIVTTVIGNHMHKSHWKPIPCEGTLNVEEVHLRWPTELTINPLDNSLYIIDDHMILQLTPDGRVKVVAGRPLHCPSPSRGYDTDLATHATLVMPQSIAFAPNGDLFVAESDSQRINRVRVIGTDGKIQHFAGAESKCNCLDRGCDCFDEDHFLAATSKFNTISSITVTPDGILHISDQANYRIRSVTSSLPEANAQREYEIFSPETQEIYIFNRFGQHTATKNILTGETIYIFTYNVNTSNGKLSTVTDAAGNKVFLLRDYSSQVNSVENTKGQKCRLRMSRMRMLQELSTPDNYNVSFDYHGSTGLLRTKLDSTGRSYIYNYDEFGRLTTAVTPTGKVISLSFDLSTVGATVKVKQDDHKPVSMLIKGPSVLKQIGEAEHHRTTLMADGSVVSVTPWQHSISTETTAYSVLSDINPVLGESFPVPAKQKTEIGGDLANRFEWRYFLRREGKGKNKAVVQIGRKLRVNGENLLTLEYDRETGTVAVFMDDRVELLNITYDRLARPVKWGPSRNGVFDGVELEYDRFSRLISWKWGDLSETYGFDRAGRLFEIRYGDNTAVTYAFKDMFSSLPLKVTTPRGSDYFLQYDEAGALQSLTTPRGHIHTFALQTSLGFFKYQYYSPMNRHPYEILYNDDSQILAKVYPHQAGKVVYVYDDTGKLENILAGLSSTQYTYQESTGLIKAVDVNEPGFELKQEFKHHAGIVKEERLKFGGKTGLDNAHFKYQYDGNARISGIDADINGKDLPPLRLKFNQNLGMLEGVSDLRVYRNTFNRSVMQDTSKQFFTITDWDSHGRLKSLLINIKFNDVYRLELEYDKRSRINSQKIMIRNKNTADRFTYNSDGHLLEVIGDGNWKYVYDENGNVIGVIERGEKINMGYDSGDRVVQYGDVEFCSYDGRGFVVRRGEQKYRYSSRSYLEHAFEKEKFQTWYHYDERGRLIAWKDDKGNTTQYFYANPSTPELVTHVHYPKTGKTNRLMYDERQVLIAVETADKRYYVASDQNGSPLVVFDTNGVIVKQITRTPFGKVTKDTNPAFHIPVDFNGGLLDPHTGLVYLNRRLYDPVIGQWMIPAWEELANKLTTPTDVFIYRFNNNDPINKAGPVKYMTDLPSWLNLYGYDVSNMMGSSYTARSVYMPKSSVTSSQLSPQFGVISGLQCIAEKISEQFRELGFIPKPLLKLEPKTRNLLPRVASRRGVFGEGVLISRVAGRALVSIVEGVNGVIQDVVTSVFNNSHLLDVRLSAHDQAIFYFVKDNALKLRDDQEELRRLGGLFNVSTHEVEHGSSPELRLHNADAAIYIRYGADPAQERHRVLRHAHKRAVERAWEIEKQLVSLGFPGRIDWSEEEREELLSHGTVDGFEGIEAHSIHRYPQLADDPSNVIFQKEGGGKRKRRKSRRSRSHRHDT